MNQNTVELATDWFVKDGDIGLDDVDLDLDDFKWNTEGSCSIKFTKYYNEGASYVHELFCLPPVLLGRDLGQY
jgi:hypothetical protein